MTSKFLDERDENYYLFLRLRTKGKNAHALTIIFLDINQQRQIYETQAEI